MSKPSIETTDIFKGAFYLCMGGDLESIRIKNGGRQIATFHFSGPELSRHDKAYVGGHALVNPVVFRQALNHLRDVLFERLRDHDTELRHRNTTARGRHENDSTRNHRSHQAYR